MLLLSALWGGSCRAGTPSFIHGELPPNLALCKANVSNPGAAGIGAAPIAIAAATPLLASVRTAKICPLSMVRAALVDGSLGQVGPRG